jgi:hypothetical protein
MLNQNLVLEKLKTEVVILMSRKKHCNNLLRLRSAGCAANNKLSDSDD